MSAEELMELLKADAGGNDLPQSGVINDEACTCLPLPAYVIIRPLF